MNANNIFQGSDELWSGYLYYTDCNDAGQLQEENRRILKSVQFANLQVNCSSRYLPTYLFIIYCLHYFQLFTFIRDAIE